MECAHAHQFMKEILSCATHGLRSKWRLALRDFSHTASLKLRTDLVRICQACNSYTDQGLQLRITWLFFAVRENQVTPLV